MTGKELLNALKKRKIDIKDFSKMINITEESLKMYLKEDKTLRNDIIIQASRILQLDLEGFESKSKIISRRSEEIKEIDFDDLNKLLEK